MFREYTLVVLVAVSLHLPALAQHDVNQLTFSGRTEVPAGKQVKACLTSLDKAKDKLTATERKILDALASEKAPAFNDVSEAWIESQITAFNKRGNTDYSPRFAKNLLINSTRGLKGDPFELKIALDDRLEKGFHKRPLIYNIDNDNAFDPLFKGKGQCLAGSLCFSMATRTVYGEKEFLDKNPVMILVDGHILPGFVMTDSKNEKWLVAIETTASGQSKKAIGKLKDLHNLVHPIRVIGANDFAILQIFLGHLDAADFACWQKALLEQTAVAYGIDQAKIEAKIAKLPAPTGKPGSTPFAFGEAKVPPGDRVRPKDSSELVPNPSGFSEMPKEIKPGVPGGAVRPDFYQHYPEYGYEFPGSGSGGLQGELGREGNWVDKALFSVSQLSFLGLDGKEREAAFDKWADSILLQGGRNWTDVGLSSAKDALRAYVDASAAFRFKPKSKEARAKLDGFSSEKYALDNLPRGTSPETAKRVAAAIDGIGEADCVRNILSKRYDFDLWGGRYAVLRKLIAEGEFTNKDEFEKLEALRKKLNDSIKSK